MEGLHERVAQDLRTARETLGHPGAKGDGSEKVWIKLFMPIYRNVMRLTRRLSLTVGASSVIRLILCFTTGNTRR